MMMKSYLLILGALSLFSLHAFANHPVHGSTAHHAGAYRSPNALMVVIQTNYNPCVTQTAIQATATISGGTGPYTYVWDNGATTATVTFTQTGTHHVTVVDATGATATASILIQLNGQGFSVGITATKDTICAGETVKLTATGDPATSYHWNTGATTATLTVTPPTTTIYQLVAFRTGTSNLVQNGDFEAGNTGFFTDYIVGTGGAYGLLTNEGTYGVGPNPHLLHTDFPTCPDHTTGTGNMMVVNGAHQPNVNVWCQTVTVAPNTEYMFSTWLETMVADNPAILQFSINNTPLGNPFHAPSTICNWSQFFEVWNSGINTSAQICIVNQNTNVAGNDFALDDISMVPVCTDTAKVTIVVSKPAVTAAATSALCNGSGGTITIIAQNGIAPYHYSLNGGATLQTNPVFTGLQPTTYTVWVTDQHGCTGTATATVGPPANFSGTVVTQQPTCGLSNGYIVVNAIQNGTPPYAFTLNGGTAQANSVFGNLAPGTYTVQVTDSLGCSFSQTGVVLNTSLPLTASTVVIKQPTCKDPTGSFQVVNVQNGFQPFGYSLDAGAHVQTSPVFANEKIGTYHIRVSDVAGCTADVTATLQQQDSLVFDLTTQSTSCGLNNGSVALEVTHASGQVDVVLNGQDKGFTLAFSGLSSGAYTVIVKDTAGCVDTAKVVLAPSSALSFKIDILKGKDLCNDTALVLHAPAGIKWKWSNDSTTQSIHVKKGGTYRVTVEDNQGCFASDSIKVDACSKLVMPNAFTPNGDGLNDTFGPTHTDNLTILEFKIYDRWGKLIFDDTKPWDGRYNDLDHPSDVLAYTIKVRTADGKLEDQHGEVTLLR